MVDSLFESLAKVYEEYILNEQDRNQIEKAYILARNSHQGQLRKSGEPYITHPVAVAIILANVGSGPNTLQAALLHDVVEDTSVTLMDLSKEFGKDVAFIVDGVTKLTKLEFHDAPSQADNHQKMLIAMAKDIRVILIKIADRLHNMRTLDSMRPENQIRIAKETLEIYAPIAHKLGLFVIKAELEDRALKYAEPAKYYEVSRLIQSKKDEREESINNITGVIDKLLKDNGLTNYKIKGRIKNIYSIYKKMYINKRSFEDIYDLLAIRIIVDKVESCYQSLGLIHANFTPIPRRFKDYIAVPKPNLYQSLHTTVLFNDGTLFEVQIRTKEMDDVAELGVAAHWAYKENKNYSKEREQFEMAQKLKWYGELLKMSEDIDDISSGSEEFVESVKGDILGANVYVFTPKGEVIELPKGATPIDFAYRIHSDVGNKMVGATVNNKIVSLDSELKTGDIVSVRTNKSSFGPSESWLKIAKSNHAKHKIKSFLNKKNAEMLAETGKDIILRELNNNKISEDITDEFVKEHFSKNGVRNLEDLYVEIAKNNISAKTVIAKIVGTEINKEQYLQRQMEKTTRAIHSTSETGVIVEGLTNPQIKLGSCCFPIPGDNILGYVSKVGGIVVHDINCPNVISLDQNRKIEVYWATKVDRKFPTLLKIIGPSKPTFLYDIVKIVNASNVNVAEMNSNTTQSLETVIKLKILIEDKEKLEKLIANIQKVSDVYSVERDYR
ncbi:RelA/SpoT family protein [Haploplasma modicum]|uniref:RelA/SpoT family protein n=1 Tax=Haploplasma modicum TaxID=2150 RepID=UPI00138AE2A9|nr:bifunctional (p)ppGpp synthetase/guanosine-3',5'-bis(diphosphate) 3'-pyrophosphohydrolase [Haploplasma modicum]